MYVRFATGKISDTNARMDVMSRRSTPERIDEARRAATHNRLFGDGATVSTADAWIEAREAQAAQDGLVHGQTYWGRAGRGSPSSDGAAPRR
jgi:hypothetical protein